MFKVFRIIFAVLAAATAAAAVFIFVFFGWMWGGLTVLVCLAFAGAMLLCRNAQLKQELRENPPPPVGDFITGKVENDEDKK